MNCGHTHVLITGQGKGHCLNCHSPVKVVSRSQVDPNLVPIQKSSIQVWVVENSLEAVH